MTDEVKNCPFCSKTVLVGYLCAEHVVKCSSCGANMNIRRMGGTQKAIAAWNHRPLEDAKDARIAELEERVAKMQEAGDVLAQVSGILGLCWSHEITPSMEQVQKAIEAWRNA